MRPIKLYISCFILLFFAACAPERTFTIIATNDIHAEIDAFPSLVTLVEQYRAAQPGRVLLVDAGDRWTGNPYVDMWEERGLPIIQMMDSLGFQLGTYGNHEFDFGLEVLGERIGQADFPFVGTNIDSNGSLLPQPAPYHFITVDGVKFCFLGLITTARAGYPDGFVRNFGEIIFSHPIETALKYRDLRDSCDVFVGLTHIGYDMDTVLARQMPELDIILGGHTHTVLPEGERVGRTLVTQSGSRLHYASITTVKMQGKKLASIDNKLVKLDTIPADPRYAAMVKRYKELPEFQTVQGSLAQKLTKGGVMNLVTDILRWRTKSDLAIYNRGGIRVDSLPAGDVTLADILSMEPFGNTIYTVKLSEQQLKALIIKKFNSIGKEGYFKDIYPSGFTYKIIAGPDGNAEDVEFDMQVKRPASGYYTIAMSDYVESTYDFPGAGTGTPTGWVISSAIVEYFNKFSPVQGSSVTRITIK